jgi:DNA-binding CsgD family transcriptional regulator
MSVNSNDNKALLWNLLSNHPNQKSDPKKFQSVLEYRVNEIHRNRFKFGNNLMTMNKEIIKQFASEMPAQHQKPPQQKPQQLSKGKIFEQRLKRQQDNFNKLINGTKPKEIDFSDKTEESPIDARMVDDTLQQRELELKNIMAQYDTNSKNANEWLKGQETSTSKHLKIDKKTNVKIESDVVNVPTKERRVRFEVEEKPTKPISFLDKLKKIDVKDEIITHLKRIEEKQNLILSLLQSKTETD